MASAAETFRGREVYRYYQPRNLKDLSDVRESSSTHSHPTYAHNVFPKATNFNTQQSFSDTALTAFAQLIALRLACQRAIVSLIDHENEYFLAESTSTLSLSDDDAPAQNAWLSISGARVPREASLCEQTLRLVPNQDTTAEMTPVFLVPDLLLDEKMSKLDCVEGAPYLRFYCGVALTNKRGINIGCVYVVDDRPRTNFSLEQAQFLTGMAATVMDHLENIRAKEDVVRMTRMSQALHAFIEGEGTMDGDWQRLKKYNLPAGEGVGFSWESNRNDGTRSYTKGKKASGGLEVPIGTSQSPLQHSEGSQDARFNFNNSPWSSSSEVLQVPTFKSVFEGLDEATTKLTGGRDAEFTTDGFSNLLHATFSRASNLVREGMEVDGAVFFDAPFRFYQGRSTLETDPRRLGDKEFEISSDSESEDHSGAEADARPGPRPHVLRSDRRTNHPDVGHSGVSMGLKSDVLGFSTHESSSWDNNDMGKTKNFTAIDQSLLTSLVRRYPQGELFVFDGDGPTSPHTEILSPESSQTTITSASIRDKFARREARKRAEILRLLVAFPGARQIFFVPLFDSTSGCFIGSFTWSTSTTRIFSTENHLSYLIAFGHSVMSEVSRLNTLSADRAKGDFISNVSHELRSPLHGILASVEFLADTTLDGFQRNLVDTVDICGRTLLDTIEHVLDFSKIKAFGQESSQPMGVVADLDVSAVIEEVLEGVFAGFEFNGLSSQGLADTTQSRTREMPNGAQRILTANEPQSSLSKNSLTVILDIDFRDQWKFPTVPGTWRRLTMNLFGNSLKYTHDGFVKVKLEARGISNVNTTIKNTNTEKTMVTMTISDSGRGMSSEFMKTKLFIPFSQEDVTAPGTGLGMSMVKQIVDLSGGTIDIRSELGKGTEIKLSLPLENCVGESDKLQTKHLSQPEEDSIDAVRRRAQGRTVTIRGFDGTFGKSDLQVAAVESLKASIQKYITEWFNLTVISDNKVADIVVSDESAFLSRTKALGSKPQLLLILCSNGARREICATRPGLAQFVEFLSKPCGPHRLAKALLNCLDKEDAVKKSNAVRVSQEGSSTDVILPQVSADDTMVTAGPKSNLRLIGNLQSSIGFSPKSTDLNRAPATHTKAKKTANQRPAFIHRISNNNEKSSSESMTESTNESNVALEASSTSTTPNSDSSYVTQGASNAEPLLDASPTSSRSLKMLLVEDNSVNMMLLATYMKKNKWDYEEATNGLIALRAFQNRPQGFDVIFMDVSMPVMNGYESTRAIRNVEFERRLADDLRWQTRPTFAPYPYPSQALPLRSFPFLIPSPAGSATSITSPFPSPEIQDRDIHFKMPTPAPKMQSHDQRKRNRNLNRRALIIALTGFSSEKDQEMAFENGVDIFMTKPVRFREVGKILDGWMKSREQDGEEEMEQRKVDREGFVGKDEGLGHSNGGRDSERRELDEGMTGAKRSG